MPDGGRSLVGQVGDVNGVPVEVRELTGRPGEVVIAHLARVPRGIAQREYCAASDARKNRSLVDFPLQPDDELSWQLRERTYLTALEDGTGFILLASEGRQPVGYVTVMLRPGGPDDTFVLGPTYGEIYSLVVSPAQRSRGIGSLLFRTAVDELDRRGIKDINVAVMSGNQDAVRFYPRQGLVPAELHLWRLASSGPGDATYRGSRNYPREESGQSCRPCARFGSSRYCGTIGRSPSLGAAGFANLGSLMRRGTDRPWDCRKRPKRSSTTHRT